MNAEILQRIQAIYIEMESTVQTSPLPETISMNDFIFQKFIGDGSFGRVFLAKNIQTNRQYAIKVSEKQQRTPNMATSIDVEKEILSILSGCTNFVHMYGFTSDSNFDYLVLEYLRNGELFLYLLNEGRIDLQTAKYYAAQILLALEILHSKGIVHRDLKPENLLLDENWHIRLIDFGLSKIVKNEVSQIKVGEKQTKNLIGTLEYMSPEVISGSEAGFASDLWAYGCIVYQLVSGLRLFDEGSNTSRTMDVIENLLYDFPKDFDTSARDLIENLLVLEPELRLGALDSNLYVSIREHEFFHGIDWDNMGEPPNITSVDRNSSKSDVMYCNTDPGFNNQILDKLYKEREEENPSENYYKDEDYSSSSDYLGLPHC